MIETSALFSQKVAESSRQFRARLLDGDKVISGDIRSVRIHKGACGESVFSPGSVFSSYIEVAIDGCEDILQDKELMLQIGLVLDEETVEYVDMGYYTVTKPTKSAHQLTFTAHGRIAAKLYAKPTWVETPRNPKFRTAADKITEASGVPVIFKDFEPNFVVPAIISGMTSYEVLQVITFALGAFATEDNAGNIVISKFTTDNQQEFDSDATIFPSTFNEYDFTITGVKIVTAEARTDEEGNEIEEVSYSYGTPNVTLHSAFMDEGQFPYFIDNVDGFTFRPGEIPLALGDPRLEPWDSIAFTDVTGETHIVPCFNIVHTFDGGLSTTITANANSDTAAKSETQGPVSGQLGKLASQIESAKESSGKTATNYLDFTTEGLVVGNMTAEILGNNVLIDSDSVDIRNGDETLASYKSDRIDLGVNSESAVIGLCGGKGLIEYGKLEFLDSENLKVSADSIRLIGDDAGLYSAYNGGDFAKAASVTASADELNGSVLITASKCDALESDGTGLWHDTEFNVTSGGINSLADLIALYSRYDTVIESMGNAKIRGDNLLFLSSSERIRTGHSLILPNNCSIFGCNTDDVTDEVTGISGTPVSMLGMSNNNNTLLGYGGYSRQEGSTNIYGHDVKITSRTAGLSGRSYGVNKVLWSGAYYMQESHSISLSEAVSAQPNGIVLAWSFYSVSEGSAKDYDWNYFFIPKEHVITESGTGVDMLLTAGTATGATLRRKYVYVSDTKITGYAGNNASSYSIHGTTVDNRTFVLRKVIGV